MFSHGTLDLAQPLIQPSRFIGKETEAQRDEETSLRWPHESEWGWLGQELLLQTASLGLFHYSKPQSPPWRSHLKRTGSCDPVGIATPTQGCTPLKEDLPITSDGQQSWQGK